MRHIYNEGDLPQKCTHKHINTHTHTQTQVGTRKLKDEHKAETGLHRETCMPLTHTHTKKTCHLITRQAKHNVQLLFEEWVGAPPTHTDTHRHRPGQSNHLRITLSVYFHPPNQSKWCPTWSCRHQRQRCVCVCVWGGGGMYVIIDGECALMHDILVLQKDYEYYLELCNFVLNSCRRYPLIMRVCYTTPWIKTD